MPRASSTRARRSANDRTNMTSAASSPSRRARRASGSGHREIATSIAATNSSSGLPSEAANTRFIARTARAARAPSNSGWARRAAAAERAARPGLAGLPQGLAHVGQQVAAELARLGNGTGGGAVQQVEGRLEPAQRLVRGERREGVLARVAAKSIVFTGSSPAARRCPATAPIALAQLRPVPRPRWRAATCRCRRVRRRDPAEPLRERLPDERVDEPQARRPGRPVSVTSEGRRRRVDRVEQVVHGPARASCGEHVELEVPARPPPRSASTRQGLRPEPLAQPLRHHVPRTLAGAGRLVEPAW